MTNAEMNRRIANMTPKALARVEWLAKNTTYSPHEVFQFRIPGTGTQANVNAVFKKIEVAS